MAIKRRCSAAEIDDLSQGLGDPTADDVSITRDGIRIDSKEKLLALIADHNRRVSVERSTPARR